MSDIATSSLLTGIHVPHVVIDRCPTGQRLYDEWTEAMASHEPILIYFTMQEYFFHKNGMGTKTPCCVHCSEVLALK